MSRPGFERSTKLMDGITGGLPRKHHRPVADGIVTGIANKPEKLAPPTPAVNPSATKFSEGVFGAGATPQGDGNAKGGSRKH